MVRAPPSVSGGKNAGVFTQVSDSHHAQTVAAIEEFFNFNPPTLCPAENHTTSEKTRGPQKFDTHLHPSLRLHRVVYLPTIEDDLKEIAEGALKSVSDSRPLPPISNLFPIPRERKACFKGSSMDEIICEEQLVSIYDQTTAKFCRIVASTLEFQHPHWSCGNLKWTSDSGKSHGVADGHLMLNNKPADMGIDPLPVGYQEITEDFPVIATWEFKSLVAGTPDVLEAIVQQSASGKDFPWQECTERDGCQIVHKGVHGELYTTRSKMGFDAQIETCKSLLLPSDPIFPHPPSSQLSEKAKTHAIHITQQTWAEAVNHDTTFVVINAGNIEIIGKRDRATQTLYVSNVIDVTACDYGKLHTGLYIAAIRDAHDRTARLRCSNPRPESWTFNSSNKKSNTGSVEMMKSVLKNILACDWLTVVTGRRYKYPFPFYCDSYWIRDPSFIPPMQQTRENRKHFIRLSVTNHLLSDTFKGRLYMDEVQFKGITGEFAGTVVIKYAGTKAAIEKLEYEYDVIQKLRTAGVNDIPKVIGLFFHQTTENNIPDSRSMAVLVMEDAGEPVNGLTLSNHHITAFMKALKSIHEAGFLHGNIASDNLIIRSNIKLKEVGVVIIGLGNAIQKSSNNIVLVDKLEIAEREKLMQLLPNASKRSESGDHTQSFVDVFPEAAALVESSDCSSCNMRPAKKHRHTTLQVDLECTHNSFLFQM